MNSGNEIIGNEKNCNSNSINNNNNNNNCNNNEGDSYFFESVEKRIILTVSKESDIDFRKVSEEMWGQILEIPGCTIISSTSNDYCNAYVLSESSLFVYEHEIILKTCGTITLLKIVPYFLRLCSSFSSSAVAFLENAERDVFNANLSTTLQKIQSFTFSHLNYMRPTIQNYPHSCVEDEVSYLNEFFNGNMYNLGPSDGNYKMYVHHESRNEECRQYLEVQMFDLDARKMLLFFNNSNENPVSVGVRMTKESGIDTIVPDAVIDFHVFKPAGYSLNGLFGPYYFTIHVTPERKFSYVSFETNAPMDMYRDLVIKVLDVFKPASFNVNVVYKDLVETDALDRLKHQIKDLEGYYRQECHSTTKAGIQEVLAAAYCAKGNLEANLDSVDSNQLSNIRTGEFLDAISKKTERMIELVLSDSSFSSSSSVGSPGGGGGGGEKEKDLGEKEKDLKISKLDEISKRNPESDALAVLDVGRVVKNFLVWRAHLPTVRPFYAVKANPDPVVLAALAALGVGFDCASQNELERVLGLDVEPERVIFANTVKSKSALQFSAARNVFKMTADNEVELQKIALYAPDAEILLRLSVDDAVAQAQCPLGEKFGCSAENMYNLLGVAKILKLNVVGVAFHVGSAASNVDAYRVALETCGSIFKEAKLYGFNLSVLDIGGGFTQEHFQDSARVIIKSLKTYFKDNITVMAEPGRFFVSNAVTLGTRVINKTVKTVKGHAEEDTMVYYIGDGIYGSFSSIMFDHACPKPFFLHLSSSSSSSSLNTTTTKQQRSIVYGPSCDSIDVVCKDIALPILNCYDWMFWEDMGAYTLASATPFNGITPPEVFYIFS